MGVAQIVLGTAHLPELMADSDPYLADLAGYVAARPPREPFAPRGEAGVVYLHPFERLLLSFERTPDLGYGLSRSDALGEQGVCCAAVDSKNFADGLFKLLAPHLSVRNLKDLVAAAATELEQRSALI
ncbi:hypothetical protein ABIC83_002572 [Roseateles asaccharophilus]|uniref:hypothetical protein n=1 Tax=Roseateles asaccharophilus TaxID=582607 RepID=UPI00383441D8